MFVYLLTPVALKQGPYEADINSGATLHNHEHRIGRELFMDRESYLQYAEHDIVLTFAKERLRVLGDIRASRSTEVTLHAEFVEPDAIKILDLYEYRYAWRDPVTLLGLLLALIYWVVALLREELMLKNNSSE